MLKVLIVIPTLDQSGAEKQFGLLACRLPHSEFDVRVVALTRGGPYEAWLQKANVPYSILHKRWRLDPVTVWKLRREIDRFQPDAVVSCLFSANTSVRLATLGQAQRPVTIVSERCVDTWKSSWQFWLDRQLRARTDHLAANSQSVAEFYQSQGFPAARMSVVPNGVEIPALPEMTRAELCRQLQLPDDARLIMYTGRLAPQKRLKDLIWAIQILRQADPRACLLLVGDGPQRTELELYAHAVEAHRQVRFLGHRTDAAPLLHLCDVFWLGSEFEGMSNSLMEAMACGKPVVVSDIPPNRELVEHGQQGYLVNLGDSIGFSQFTQRLIDDQNLAARLGQAGAQRMQTAFSIDLMVQSYAALIRQQVLQRS